MGTTHDLASNYFGDTLPQAQAGPLGLLIIILLGVGLWLLIRSMNRHLRKMPTSFDPAAAERRHRGEPEPPPAPPDQAADVERPVDKRS